MATRGLRLMTPRLALVWLLATLPAAAVPIPGKLLTSGWNTSSSFSYFMVGSSNSILTPSVNFVLGDISPDSSKVSYSVTVGGSYFYAQTGDVWVANADGSGPVNLTAGLTGVNCTSAWSPDGSMIAFQHSDPATDQQPCDAGWQVWVMNSDGTNAHQLRPAGSNPTWFPTWSPDGARILCEDWGLACITMDLDGGDVQLVPSVNGEDAKWSRDGARLIDSSVEPDTVDGRPGVWRRLRLLNPDGTEPQVLVEQFVADADVQAHIAKYDFQPPEFTWQTNIRALVGPLNPRWSPTGDQIAFIAALPFDPDGVEYWYQREVWLYDLNSHLVTRLTSDLNSDNWISWNGNNTYPVTNRQITVANTTVSFAQVTSQGLTYIILDRTPPPPPAGYQFAGNCYLVHTTAGISGLVTVKMTYPEKDILAGSQPGLAILRYDSNASRWWEVTLSVDTARDAVTAQTDSLGLFALALPIPQGHFSDVPATGLGPIGVNPYWAFWEIEAAYAAGIVQGSNGAYLPADEVTRDQMAVYMARAMSGGNPTGPAEVAFTDITNPWANPHIAYCVANGVVQGLDATHYAPKDPVTRDQLAVFIARSQGWVVIGEDMTKEAPAAFIDVPLGQWAGKAIKACVDHGVVKGYDATHYVPEGVVTRDQMAVFVARAFGLAM